MRLTIPQTVLRGRQPTKVGCARRQPSSARDVRRREGRCIWGRRCGPECTCVARPHRVRERETFDRPCCRRPGDGAGARILQHERTDSKIDLDERRKFERRRQACVSVDAFAEKLGHRRSTIFREISEAVTQPAGLERPLVSVGLRQNASGASDAFIAFRRSYPARRAPWEPSTL